MAEEQVIANDVTEDIVDTTVVKEDLEAEVEEAPDAKPELTREQKKNLSKLLYEAEKDFDHNPKSARKKLQDALNINPDSFEANFMMANLLMGFEEYEEAKVYYEKTLATEGNDLAKPYYNYGVLLANFLDNTEGALEAYKQAIEIEPKFPHCCYNMGNIYARVNKDFPEARKKYEEAIAHSEVPLVEAYYNLGRVLMAEFQEEDDHLKAKECFEQVLRIRPKYVSALYHYGKLLMDKLNDEENAKIQLEKVYDLDKSHWRAEQRLRRIKQNARDREHVGVVDEDYEKSKSKILEGSGLEADLTLEDDAEEEINEES